MAERRASGATPSAGTARAATAEPRRGALAAQRRPRAARTHRRLRRVARGGRRRRLRCSARRRRQRAAHPQTVLLDAADATGQHSRLPVHADRGGRGRRAARRAARSTGALNTNPPTARCRMTSTARRSTSCWSPPYAYVQFAAGPNWDRVRPGSALSRSNALSGLDPEQMLSFLRTVGSVSDRRRRARRRRRDHALPRRSRPRPGWRPRTRRRRARPAAGRSPRWPSALGGAAAPARRLDRRAEPRAPADDELPGRRRLAERRTSR